MVRRPEDEEDRPRDTEEEEDPVELLDALMSADSAPLPPMAPDGGFMPSPMGEPASIPEATPETMICMAGPCRHYVEQSAWFPSGNVEGSPGYNARETVRYCDRLRSAHISLTDEIIFDCNAWIPLSPAETKERAKNRERLVQLRTKGE